MALDFLKYEKARYLNFEFNNTCYLKCSGCGRTDNPNILNNKQIIPFEKIKEWFDPEYCSQLSHFQSCGNYGEPIVHPECIDILRYFSDNETNLVSISTNGGARPPEWWKELATVCHGRYGKVTFSIDGLEDTNHIYRGKVKWDRLMENVRSFIDAGGRAHWRMLVFEHNQHQVQDVRDLAKSIGFSSFDEKLSFRGAPTDLKKTMGGTNLPSEKEYIHPDRIKLKELHTHYHTVNINKCPTKEEIDNADEFYDNIKIKCMAEHEESLYVSHDGKVYPCNWLGGAPQYVNYETDYKVKAFDDYDENFNSLYHHTLRDILKHEWFVTGLEDSWKDIKKCPRSCTKMCSTYMDPYNNMLQNQEDFRKK